MNLDDEAVKTIASTIKDATQQVINNANFDRTVKGRIIAYSGGNRYQVQLNDGEKYPATSYNAYNIGEIVYIKIAGNNYSNLIIESPITKTNESSTWTLEDRSLDIHL